MQKLKKHEAYIAFIIIFLFVGISNIPSIFGLDTLLSDDNARYLSFVNGNRDFSGAREFVGLAKYFKLLGIYLYSSVSAEAARAFYVFFYMIPLSFLLYYFNRRSLNLALWISLGAAIIVNIMPKQLLIPAFIDGSYPVIGMPVFVISLILMLSYTGRKNVNYFLLVSSLFFWLLANDLLAEMGIFLLPVVIILISTENSSIKRKLSILIPVTGIFIFRLVYYFNSLDAVNTPVQLTSEDIKLRILRSLEWWWPINASQLETQIIYIALIIVICLGMFIILRSKHTKRCTLRALVIYSVWFIFTSIPFWFLATYFTVRHVYISHIALSFLFFILAYQVISTYISSNNIVKFSILFVALSVFGFQRYDYTKEVFDKINRKNERILSMVENNIFTNRSQIALINIENGTGSMFAWSSGYLAFILKNPNIRGIIGDEYNFYNPFQKINCLYKVKMSCLNTEKQLIAIRMDKNTNISRKMHYFLQWKMNGAKDSDWVIYKSDSENRLSIFSSGKGLDSYKRTLDNFSLGSEHVLWGDLNDLRSFN